MARGRMLSKDISLDEKVDALSDDTARLLFTWLIPHLDCEGRMYGEPQIFKSLVAPRRNYSVKRVEKYLTEMEKLGLIERYSVNGNHYIFASGFEKHQTGLRKDKEAPSKIPPITPDKGRSKSRLTHLQVKEKRSIIEENIKNIKKENIELPDWIDKEIWDAFLEMRKKKRAVPTEKAIELLIKEIETLKKSGNDPNEVLKQSIMRNYTGVFPLKESSNGRIGKARGIPGNRPVGAFDDLATEEP